MQRQMRASLWAAMAFTLMGHSLALAESGNVLVTNGGSPGGDNIHAADAGPSRIQELQAATENCDQNDDGQFTGKDIILFWKNCKGSTEPECDINSDGKFNRKDVELFKEGCQAQLSGKIPDTGQTQSYTTTFGEDHDYLINPPFYTNNGNGTVTDNVTGLIWQQADDGVTRTWAKAISYCENLFLTGHSDWRLPSLWELTTIVDYGVSYPAINTSYFSCQSSNYWSATTYVHHPDLAWFVYFYLGYDGWYYKSNTFYVRCVRGGR